MKHLEDKNPGEVFLAMLIAAILYTFTVRLLLLVT
jgi:hypothetical protein